MVDHFDELVILLLRTDGKRAAVATYQEESGASRAEAVRAVAALAEKHGLGRSGWSVKRRAAISAALLTIGVLAFIVFGS